MVTNGGRQRTGIALLANPQEYVLEVRSATIALLVGAASTVLWQAIRQALIPSIALGVAATVVVLLINFRRRSQWLQSLGRVLSDPSSSGSAFALVTEVRSMAANRTKPARIEEFIKTSQGDASQIASSQVPSWRNSGNLNAISTGWSRTVQTRWMRGPGHGQTWWMLWPASYSFSHRNS